MKPVLLTSLLNGMTVTRLVTAAERNEREAKANARLMAAEAEQVRKVQAAQEENNRVCLELDRPEYVYAKNAQRKAKKYQRAIKARNQ